MTHGKSWHPERIKAELRMRDVSLKEMAAQLNVTPSVVSTAIRYRNRRNRRVEQAVAARLKRSPAQIWPDRYPSIEELTAA
jgi:lambda repressor-like predicted transcriptional regulator